VFWGVFFHEDNEPLSARERLVREVLAKSHRIKAVNLSLGLWGENASDIAKCFLPVLKALWAKIRDKGKDWIEGTVDRAPKGAGEEYYLPRFHQSALQGVVDILEVMLKHWNGEIGWESWTGPVQTTSSCRESPGSVG